MAVANLRLPSSPAASAEIMITEDCAFGAVADEADGGVQYPSDVCGAACHV